jgi:antitoxin ParD1/3/4
MRTNIEIDDKLMTAAMRAGGFSTKREAVEEGLKLIARRKSYARILALGGQVMWSDATAAPNTAIAAQKRAA